MYALIIGFIILFAILLTLVVLAQNPKGGGLSSQFGGGSTTQIMGVKKTNDVLEKLTWGFAIALLVLTLSTNFFLEEATSDAATSPNLENVQSQSAPAIPQSSESLDGLGLEESATDSSGN